MLQTPAVVTLYCFRADWQSFSASASAAFCEDPFARAQTMNSVAQLNGVDA